MQSMWLWVVGVVVVVGVGAYVFMGQGGAGSPTETSNTNEQATDTSQPTSLNALIAAGVAQKCTFTSSTDNSSSSGTVYVSGGMMRGDFTSVSSGQTINSYMIVKDNTSYLWSDASPQGITMSFAATGSASSEQSGVDVNAEYNYSCSPWAPEQSVFIPPTSINFMSYGQMMP